MTDSSPEIWARLLSGEPVTAEELARALACSPPPQELDGMELRAVKPKRGRGRPRKWSERDKRTIAALVERVRFWSEIESTGPDGRSTPLPKEEIYRRVGAALRSPMEGKSVENLIADYRKGTGMRVFRDEDFRGILAPDPE